MPARLSRRTELDEFFPLCQQKALKGLCDGSCEEHRGDVRAVRVFYGATDWGWFSYCEEAIAEDERRGMDLEYAEDQI